MPRGRTSTRSGPHTQINNSSFWLSPSSSQNTTTTTGPTFKIPAYRASPKTSRSSSSASLISTTGSNDDMEPMHHITHGSRELRRGSETHCPHCVLAVVESRRLRDAVRNCRCGGEQQGGCGRCSGLEAQISRLVSVREGCGCGA
ncbi:hypothetical protein MBLNU230_g4903t1 [Neophaeotheca triangularis]